MRLIILSTLLFFFNPIFAQEGTKIDLKNVDVATNRLPTIILFGDEYTIRYRTEFLESLLKSQFYLYLKLDFLGIKPTAYQLGLGSH